MVKRSLLLGISTSVIIAALVIAMNSRSIGSVLAVITCATTTPCEEGNNTSTGAGLLGQSKSSHGIIGITLFNSTNPSNGESAIFGEDLSTSGVYDMGIQGLSVRGYGVRGRSTSNIGVRGDSTSSYGLYGTSSSGYGAYATGLYGGLYAQGTNYALIGLGGNTGLYTSGSSLGLLAISNSGDAVEAYTAATSHWAITAASPNGSGVLINGNSRGVDATGGYIGVVAQSNQFPIAAYTTGGSLVFYVNGNGDVYYHGGLHAFATTTSGTTAVTSYTRATSPGVEETGTAHLVFGTANVTLTPSFSRSIDPRLGYQVFLTPSGDTRGLYVANRYIGGFTVREVQGGRGTFNFDYRVYARSVEPVNAPAQPPAMLPAPAINTKLPPVPTRP